MASFNGQSLFVSALAGLTNTYATLAQNSKNGTLSMNDLTNSENLKNLNLNQSFLQYMTTNFGQIDKNGDGLIDQNDINNLCTTFQTKGLTYNEIVQFYGSNGNSTLLDTVTSYFNEIDKNKDGRVTMEEINSFNSEADRERLTEEYGSFDGNGFSVFYGSEESTYKKGSVLSSKYPSNNKSS